MNLTANGLPRTLLVLGRVSNLPTVWTNCLAGWWLSGGGNYWKLPFLLLGTSALYVGGMYLNDAFDEEFDRQRRPERPIPSGKIASHLVWGIGLALLAVGVLLCLPCGWVAALASVVLAAFILLYDLSHKVLTASPWLIGICRFWVYIVAGATGINGLTGFPIFCGVALALYVAGLSYVAKRETFRGTIPHWPLITLAAPIVLAMVMNIGEYRVKALWISIVVALWIVRSIWTLFTAAEIMAGRIVANLLAGIVFVDWLAVAPDSPKWFGFIFLAMLGLTKWMQKFVPAT
jgi:4-hydroxybenzoate polyprenyltransferase